MKRFISKLLALCRKRREALFYLIFGGLAALLNTAAYGLFFHVLLLSNAQSTALAWLFAVLFAFFTNKTLVFQSRKGLRAGLKEFFSFFLCRAATGAVDLGIMVLAVDLLGQNSILWKILSNVVITVLNYLAGKFWIFKK
ncbi:MAG: GtrA family protein [Clostridia bacterium]|nr:GtrA family protein [Clostridia bacterium]